MTERHLITGTEWGQQGIYAIAQRAHELAKGAAPKQCPGARIAALFMNASLRTRTSLESAAVAMGIHPIVLQPGRDSWKLEMEAGAVMDGDKAEHIQDAVRVLGGYVDLLAIRAFATLEDMETDRADPVVCAATEHSTVPVLNLESALWHPLQGMADATTWMSHFGTDLSGVPLTLSWAPHPKALPAASVPPAQSRDRRAPPLWPEGSPPVASAPPRSGRPPSG